MLLKHISVISFERRKLVNVRLPETANLARASRKFVSWALDHSGHVLLSALGH